MTQHPEQPPKDHTYEPRPKGRSVPLLAPILFGVLAVAILLIALVVF